MRVSTGTGRKRRTPLAKAEENVLEFNPETFDMNCVRAFWFHFYGFPLPLAEGLI
jgi:hypothetical protein